MTEFKPGIYKDIPESDYHSGAFGPSEDSISSTDAKRLNTAPALYKYHREHGQAPRAAFDLGHVAHALILGTGLPIYVHDHESLRTKAAREDVAAHREAGEVPISRADYEGMVTLADSVLSHPAALRLLQEGVAEQSGYIRHEVDGETVWLRGRVDWETVDPDTGTPLLVDLKTTVSSHPDEISRTITRYDYDLQAVWYSNIWEQITGKSYDFYHIFVEKSAPHIVTVAHMEHAFIEGGNVKATNAIKAYMTAQRSGVWPGYYPDTEAAEIMAPNWYLEDSGLIEQDWINV